MKLLKYLDASGIYLFGLIVISIGLPLSNFLMSIGQVIIAIVWLSTGNYLKKFQRLWKNKGALIFSSILFLHIIGLLYSSDYSYAFNDIRIKLPLLVLPLFIASFKPLSKKQFATIMLVFTSAVLIGTLVATGELIGLNNYLRSFLSIPERLVLDARGISMYISHIRFSLMICLAIFFLAFSYLDRSFPFRLNKWMVILVCAWMFVFLFLMESITGLGIIIVVGLIFLIYKIIAIKTLKRKLAYLSILILLPVSLMIYLSNFINDFYHIEVEQIVNLDKKTADGNDYYHDLKNMQMENGKRVWLYICKIEIETEWNKRSNFKFSGKDMKGQDIEYTLLRFLTSKGLRKDGVALRSLTSKEVKMVEYGIANIRYNSTSSIESKLYGIIWEIDYYFHGGNPGGHSVVQRWEYWKTAIRVIGQNWIIGVGTGDVLNKMYEGYANGNTVMEKKYWKRPHNQFLSIGVAFGVLGLLWFILGLLLPISFYPVNADKLFYVFLMIALMSMLAEDTLETQAGATFVSFLYALLLFGRNIESRTQEVT